MGLLEGSVVPVTLRCGCQQVSIVLVNGDQRIQCNKCHYTTAIRTKIKNGEVESLNVEWG